MKSSNSNINLNFLGKKAFKGEIDYEIFKKWLEMNDSIEAIFIDRKNFSQKKGKILIKKREKTNKSKPSSYKLFLPTDLQIGEIYDIIAKIDKIIYTNSPKDSTLNNLIATSALCIASILKQNKNEGTDLTKIIENLLNKSSKYISQTQLDLIQNFKITSYTQAKQILQKLKEAKSIGKFMENELTKAFDTIFFERGKENLFKHLTTFTQQDFLKIQPSELTKLKYENIDDYSQNEEKLSKKLKISYYQKLLQKNKSNPDKHIQIQKEFIDLLYQEITRFPRQLQNGADLGASPKHMLKTKEMICLGKSIICHTFLDKVGIQNSNVNFIDHSAVLIQLNKTQYCYLDATNNDCIYFTTTEKLYKISLNNPNRNSKQASISNSNGLISSMYCNLGATLNNKGENVKAFSCYTKAQHFDKHNITWYNNIGFRYLLDKKDTKTAIKYFKKSVQFEPINFEGHKGLGKCYYEQGKFKLAIKEFETAFTNKSDEYIALDEIGKCYEKLDNIELAIKYYCKGIKACLNKTSSLDKHLSHNKIYSVLLLLIKLGRIKDLNRYYNSLCKFDKNNAQHQINKGNMFDSIGQKNKAIYHFKAAIKIDPQTSECYNQIGRFFYKNKDYTQALFRYNKAIKIDENDIDAYIFKADTYLEIKDYGEVYNIYKLLYEKLKKNTYKYEMIDALIQLQEYDECIKLYNEIIIEKPDSYIPYYGIGEMYFKLGNYKKAKQYFKKALKLKPDNDHIIKALNEIETNILQNKNK